MNRWGRWRQPNRQGQGEGLLVKYYILPSFDIKMRNERESGDRLGELRSHFRYEKKVTRPRPRTRSQVSGETGARRTIPRVYMVLTYGLAR